MIYAILVKPNSNIAFVEQYLKMCQVELGVMLQAYSVMDSAVVSGVSGAACGKLSSTVISVNKAYYIQFEVDGVMSSDMERAVYELSFFHMIFQISVGGMFRPVVIDRQPDFGDDLSTRMKYNGKTNEQITRMMMTMAHNLSDFAGVDRLNLLDPMCGRGTTLFEGMISGFDVYGVERDKNAFKEMGTYITRYVKDARFKHTNKRGKVLIGGKNIGESFELEYAKDKSRFKSKDVNRLKVLCGNTTDFTGAFRKNMMHLLVVDLPYNVQHKAKGGAEDSKAKGLGWLLEAGLKEWTGFLKKGGCVAVSWNIYTDKREEFVRIFEAQGFEVQMDNGLNQLEHRVAQAITRDIIIAKKK